MHLPRRSPAARHGHSAGDELVDLIDEHDQVIGTTTRREVRQRNLLHRGVGILCCNLKGEVYVHQRSHSKDLFPGMFDMLVGGVVASLESYAAAAEREVAEELGCHGAVLEPRFELLYRGKHNYSLIHVFRTVWDGPITHQDGEIIWGRWMPASDIEAWTQAVPVVPDGLAVYHRYLAWCRERGVPLLG